MLGRIDRRNTGVVALVMQAVRGDDSVQVLEGVRLNDDSRVGGSGKPWR